MIIQSPANCYALSGFTILEKRRVGAAKKHEKWE